MSSETLVPGLSFSLLTDDLHPTTYLGPELALTMTAGGKNTREQERASRERDQAVRISRRRLIDEIKV
jgi:hypothetical protein